MGTYYQYITPVQNLTVSQIREELRSIGNLLESHPIANDYIRNLGIRFERLQAELYRISEHKPNCPEYD